MVSSLIFCRFGLLQQKMIKHWISCLEGELCVKSLAIHFAQTMVRESFITLPLSLLEASIDHPDLTIKSEMDLCNALLLWYENQAYGSPEKAAVENPIYLSRKIQLDLLPIEFIIRRLLGKYALNTFYTSSTTSIIVLPSDHLSSLDCHGSTGCTTRKVLFASEHEVWPDFLKFINMEKLNLSRCWRIEHKTLQLWLKLVCPNLREL